MDTLSRAGLLLFRLFEAGLEMAGGIAARRMHTEERREAPEGSSDLPPQKIAVVACFANRLQNVEFCELSLGRLVLSEPQECSGSRGIWTRGRVSLLSFWQPPGGSS